MDVSRTEGEKEPHVKRKFPSTLKGAGSQSLDAQVTSFYRETFYSVCKELF